MDVSNAGGRGQCDRRIFCGTDGMREYSFIGSDKEVRWLQLGGFLQVVCNGLAL